MNTSTFPIKQGSHIGGRWHDIEFNTASGERTEAMNLHGGRVLVRTTVRDSEYGEEGQPPSIAVSTSMLTLSDAMVIKRWAPHVIEPHFDEEEGREEPGVIVLSVEQRIAPPTWTHLRSGNTDLLRPEYASSPTGLPPAGASTRPVFRWFCADDTMPRPTDEQVRAYVDGLPPPSEADSLRRELDKMRERYLEAEERVSEARGAKDDHEEPWIWSDDDTAKTVDELGNMMVVRITGGHLRALLNQRRREDRAAKVESQARKFLDLEQLGWVMSNFASPVEDLQWQADKDSMTAIAPTPALLMRAIEMCSEDCPVVHIGADGKVKCECDDNEGDEHSPLCPLSRHNPKTFAYAQEIGQV